MGGGVVVSGQSGGQTARTRLRRKLEVRRAVAHALDVHRRVGKIVRERFAATERGSCGKWRVARNLHFMAEGERATEHSREVPPTADRAGGSPPSPPLLEFPAPQPPTPPAIRRR